MTALIEFKQKIKNLYGRYALYLQPLLKFTVALLFFIWINQNLGYMSRLDNIFVVLILALVCSILPSGVMVFVGFLMIIGHAYTICLEAGAFALVLLLLLSILFLRFSGGQNIVLVCTPLAFSFDIRVLLPIGSGLLGNVFTVFPAISGVIVYYFVRLLRTLAPQLAAEDLETMERAKLLADGFIQDWAMWLTILAFLVTILLVNLIRTRSFDYAWRVSIIIGGVCYVLCMVIGGMFLSVQVNMTQVAIQTVISVLIGLLIEFFFFGGDYSRTERLEYEDDEYYYYVKAVPKTTVAASERNIKKITSMRDENSDERFLQEQERARRLQRGGTPQTPPPAMRVPNNGGVPVNQNPAGGLEQVDFERKLEESLRDL